MTASLRDMELFIAIYEEGSLTSAAQRENASQPGLSQHLRKLETALDVKLFNRHAAGVSPTPAGDRFYRQTVEVLRAHGRAMRSVGAFSRGMHDDITVGLMPTVTRWALASALERFVDEQPNVRVRIVEGFSGFLTQQVQAGALTFAIVPPAAETIGLRSTLLLRTPEVLVTGRRSGLEHRAPVRLGELGALKMVVPSRQNVRRLTLEQYFTANDVQIERLLELDTVLGALSFVAHTDWKLIAPAIVLREPEDARTLTVNPIRDPEISADLVLVEKASQPLPPSCELFLEMLVAEMSTLNRAWE